MIRVAVRRGCVVGSRNTLRLIAWSAAPTALSEPLRACACWHGSGGPGPGRQNGTQHLGRQRGRSLRAAVQAADREPCGFPSIPHGADEEGLCLPAPLYRHHRREDHVDPGGQAANLRHLSRHFLAIFIHDAENARQCCTIRTSNMQRQEKRRVLRACRKV